MTWHNNKKVKGTFTSNDPQWAWAKIEDLGWKRIKSGAADGVSNLFILFCTASASSRPVNIDLDDGGLIVTAYLL